MDDETRQYLISICDAVQGFIGTTSARMRRSELMISSVTTYIARTFLEAGVALDDALKLLRKLDTLLPYDNDKLLAILINLQKLKMTIAGNSPENIAAHLAEAERTAEKRAEQTVRDFEDSEHQKLLEQIFQSIAPSPENLH